MTASALPWRFKAFFRKASAADLSRFFNVALENLAIVIDRSPQVVLLTLDLHEHLVEAPAPVAKALHSADPLAANIGCEHWPEPVPTHPHRLVADVDPAFEQQVLDIPQ